MIFLDGSAFLLIEIRLSPCARCDGWRKAVAAPGVNCTRFVGSTGGCIGLLAAYLSEVGCRELHLVQESCVLPTGAVSRSRA